LPTPVVATEVPVLIAGGGAAGSMLLLELARRGVEARCVDRLPGPAPTSRAITVHARTAEIFERIDQRLIDRCLERALPSKGYVLHFVDDLGKRRSVRPGLDFTTLRCRYPRLFVHGQHDTEQLLREHLQETTGRSVEWGTELIDIRHAVPGAVVTLRRADGVEELVHARYVVACDGKNSRVRRTLKLVQDESDYKGSVMQNLDGFLLDFPDTDEYVHYCVGRNHFVMVVKLPGGYHRMLLSDRGESARGNLTPQQAFQGILDQHFDGVGIGEEVWYSKWESWVRLSHTYRDRDVFLAGDSAHVHSTTGGQGMNCCLQDAWNLGWKLAMVLKGHAPASLLDSYEAERKPIAEQVIWAASSLHEIFMGHGQSLEQRAARLSDPAFLDQVIGRCSGIAYTYRNHVASEPGAATPEGGPCIGDRAPDLELGDGKSLYGATRTPGFALLVIPGLSGHDANALRIAREAAAPHPQTLSVFDLSASDALTRAYGACTEPWLYVIRPDAYVAYACPASAGVDLRGWLSRTLAG
jgi:2-polyprenyl-6-methoxyphenol hydroxylase-like FAD-dependent oxidoreductase